MITRLGGSGACIHLHRGNIAQAIPCVDSMDFDKDVCFGDIKISEFPLES